jgi:galactokinase
MQIFNEKVGTYEVAQALVIAKYPEFRKKIVHLRDINSRNLGIQPKEIYDVLLSIPEHITRAEVKNTVLKEDLARLDKVFSSHEEPDGGYQARRVALFGIAEIERARVLPEFLHAGDMKGLGNLMNISHNGDRVSRYNDGKPAVYDNSSPDNIMINLRDNNAELYLQPGGYGCSTPLIDEMVDKALRIDGVMGVQLSGAGLGGCIMALVKDSHIKLFHDTITKVFYEEHELVPSVETCFPIEGSGVVKL